MLEDRRLGLEVGQRLEPQRLDLARAWRGPSPSTPRRSRPSSRSSGRRGARTPRARAAMSSGGAGTGVTYSRPLRIRWSTPNAGGIAKIRVLNAPSACHQHSHWISSYGCSTSGWCSRSWNQNRCSSSSRRSGPNRWYQLYIPSQPSAPGGVSMSNGLGKRSLAIVVSCRSVSVRR